MKKLLIVVDYQNDFVTGALGFDAAVKIEDRIVEKIQEYRQMGEDGEVIFTMDTHEEDYMETVEGKNLPVPHCLEDGEGWTLYGKVAEMAEVGDKMFCKPTFPSYDLAEYLRERAYMYESVEFAGVVTNICVISNAMIAKAALPEVPVIVDAACCAGVTPESHRTALQAMKMCQIKVINEDV